MTDLDLRDPLDLERAEEATAAAARAIAHEPSLRYRAHLLHLGPRIAPVLAPHVRPSVDTQDVADLRGGADAIALRLRHSDPALYRRHRPEGGVAELAYEILEQFRVEALAPEAAPGIRANLRHRFDSWSDAYIGEGLLENDLGLLLFAVVHVCRSRILAEPIEERVNDHTEATRFGIYELLGEHLVALRSSIHDQDAFAVHASAIASALGEIAAAQDSDRPGAVRASEVLAMLEFNAFEREEHDSAASEGQSRLGTAAEYAVFTTAYDRIDPVEDVVAAHARRTCRMDLDALVAEHRPLGAYLARSVQALFPAPLDESWESEQEQGRLDPRLLTRLVTGSGDGRLFRNPMPVDRPAAAVTVLIDCSGSMKAAIPDVAVLVDLLVRALDSVDVQSEVLGYTTGAWSGGRPYKEWLAAGRPPHPGRLNESSLIVFKDAEESWRRSRSGIASLLWTPMFREGIDAEALEWASGRLMSLDVPRRSLILVSDGSPMDGATLLTNDEGYLDRHLTEVVDGIEAQGAIRVAGLGIGHDMSAYLGRSRILDPERILDPATARAVTGFLAGD
ncbi:MAG: cobaltochelatase CobT-related protein [Candidatus Nanopelagicales bacterium]